MYAPPEGIGPAQAAYLVTEQVDDEQYIATLMYAAEKGAIDLDRSDAALDHQGQERRRRAGPGLDPVTSGVAHLLGGPGTSFVAAPKDVEAGQAAQERDVHLRVEHEVLGVLLRADDQERARRLGPIVIGASFIAVIAIAIWNPFDMSSSD